MASSTPVSVSMINFFTMMLACNPQSLEGFMPYSENYLFHQLQCEDVLFPTLLLPLSNFLTRHPLIVVSIAKTITASVVSKLEKGPAVFHTITTTSHTCAVHCTCTITAKGEG